MAHFTIMPCYQIEGTKERAQKPKMQPVLNQDLAWMPLKCDKTTTEVTHMVSSFLIGNTTSPIIMYGCKYF